MDAKYTFGQPGQYNISLESMDYAALPINKLIDKYRTKETCIKMRIFDIDNDKVTKKDEINDLESYFEYEIESISNYSKNLEESLCSMTEDKENFNLRTKHCYICRINIPQEHFNNHVTSSLHVLNLKIVQDSVSRLNESMIHELNSDHDLTAEHTLNIDTKNKLKSPLFCTICNEAYDWPFHMHSQIHSLNATKLKLLENFTNFHIDKHFNYGKNKKIPKCDISSNAQEQKNMPPQDNMLSKNNAQQKDLHTQNNVNLINRVNLIPQNALQPQISVQPQKKLQLIKMVQPEKTVQKQKEIVQPQKKIPSTSELSNQDDEMEFARIVGTAKIANTSNGYFCHDCNVSITRNLNNLKQHIKGDFHKSNVNKMTEKYYICTICNVKVPNHNLNIFEHLNGQAHKKKINDMENKKNKCTK